MSGATAYLIFVLLPAILAACYGLYRASLIPPTHTYCDTCDARVRISEHSHATTERTAS